MHIQILNQLPTNLTEIHIQNIINTYKYTLRTNKTYTIPIPKLTRTIDSLLIKSPTLWNLLPINIKNIKNDKVFKKRVTYLIYYKINELKLKN